MIGRPRPGDRLGPYRIERVLGAGGMGAVYVGVHATTGARHALKVPFFEDDQGDGLARFRREAEVLAGLSPHVHIVRVHGVGQQDGRPFCVLELVDGEGLDSIARREPLPPRRAVELSAQVARALEHIHAAGVLHRDLKPANVLVRRDDGRAVLVDFGLARDAAAEKERLTRTGEILGTPAYMAPEQVEGRRDVDARADVYGLGAILYELLAGKPPFQGDAVSIMKKILLDVPAAPSRLRDGVPAELDRVVAKALAKSRLERYPSATELREELERFLRGEPLKTRPRRRRGPIVVAAAVAIAAAGGSVAIARRSPGEAPVTSSSTTAADDARAWLGRARQHESGAAAGTAPERAKLVEDRALEADLAALDELIARRPAGVDEADVHVAERARERARALADARSALGDGPTALEALARASKTKAIANADDGFAAVDALVRTRRLVPPDSPLELALWQRIVRRWPDPGSSRRFLVKAAETDAGADALLDLARRSRPEDAKKLAQGLVDALDQSERAEDRATRAAIAVARLVARAAAKDFRTVASLDVPDRRGRLGRIAVRLNTSEAYEELAGVLGLALVGGGELGEETGLADHLVGIFFKEDQTPDHAAAAMADVIRAGMGYRLDTGALTRILDRQERPDWIEPSSDQPLPADWLARAEMLVPALERRQDDWAAQVGLMLLTRDLVGRWRATKRDARTRQLLDGGLRAARAVIALQAIVPRDEQGRAALLLCNFAGDAGWISDADGKPADLGLFEEAIEAAGRIRDGYQNPDHVTRQMIDFELLLWERAPATRAATLERIHALFDRERADAASRRGRTPRNARGQSLFQGSLWDEGTALEHIARTSVRLHEIDRAEAAGRACEKLRPVEGLDEEKDGTWWSHLVLMEVFFLTDRKDDAARELEVVATTLPHRAPDEKTPPSRGPALDLVQRIAGNLDELGKPEAAAAIKARLSSR